jgi:cell division protein FtsZ
VERVPVLRENVDSLIMIPNQRLLAIAGATLSMLDAFKKADEVLLNAVQGISDLINHTGLINSDFADVRTIMQNKGLALMGIGHGEGEHRAIEAATNAISSPLLEDVSVDGATGIIINVTGGSTMTIHEVNEATTLIMEAAHEDAEIIFGTVIDESMKDKVKVTVIATGLGGKEFTQRADTVMQAQPAVASQQVGLVAGTGGAIGFTNPQPQAAQASALERGAPASAILDETIAPPQPNAQMLAAAAAFVKGQAQGVEPCIEPCIEEEKFQMQSQAQATSGEHLQIDQSVTPGLSALVSGSGDSAELTRARAIAQRLGITNLTDDEYDIPTYLRRQQEREI